MLSDVYGEKAKTTWCVSVRRWGSGYVAGCGMDLGVLTVDMMSAAKADTEEGANDPDYGRTWGALGRGGPSDGFVTIVTGDYWTARDAALAEYRDHQAYLEDLDSRADDAAYAAGTADDGSYAADDDAALDDLDSRAQ